MAIQAVELVYIDSISYEAVRRILKKRTQALAAKRVVDSTGTQWQFFANMEIVLVFTSDLMINAILLCALLTRQYRLDFI